ncbi:hypothetical protein P167DRAFT_540438 [Morchella conica CCBAS932]|uniref:Uncharacterized protein n=1 Tax=Morchella conica CCBAS932 TaxID=1392247 RepID=A0A3N4K9A1_9PEZI|nr:hypothetical protein P167DRAFT_540438 [Morchella conica CCBAS932]
MIHIVCCPLFTFCKRVSSKPPPTQHKLLEQLRSGLWKNVNGADLSVMGTRQNKTRFALILSRLGSGKGEFCR